MTGCLFLCLACSSQESFLTAAAELQGEVIAVLDGEQIRDKDLDIKAELMKLEQDMYQVRREALEKSIVLRLLTKEASAKGMEVMELLASVVDRKVPEPTQSEVRAYYEKRKSRLRKPFAELQGEITALLRKTSLQQARNDYINSLRQNIDLEILLTPPRLSVNLQNAHVTGPENAPITLVEFSDFQCPYCRRIQPTLKELFEEYEGEIRWVFKVLPLKQIHPGAVRAAEAARCAGEQDEFWSYRYALFELERVTNDVHSDVARSLNLDYETWSACIDSGKYVAAVEADRVEATKLGIKGTPAFLINGILLSGAQPKEAFTSLIEAELSNESK